VLAGDVRQRSSAVGGGGSVQGAAASVFDDA
jgi:hypothetical protein